MDNTQRKRVAGAAVIVMISLVVSRLTGYIREALIPNMITVKYGETISDAYGMAFRITDIMYIMLIGGSIAAALIPILTGYIEKNQEEEGWKAVGTFINVTFLLMVVLCIFGVIFSPQIVPVIASGFGENASAMTIKLSRILFPSVGFLMLAGLCNGVLNSYQRFAAAAFGPSLYNICGTLSILFLSGFGVEAVAIGVMCSSALYFLFQLSFVFKNLKYYKFKIYLKNKGFHRLYKVAIPSLLSSMIVQINVLITLRFIASFKPGSVTAFNMADKLWQMPLGIFAQGLGMAILPALSASAAVGELKHFKELLMKGLKNVLVVSIPSAVGLIALSYPIMNTFMKLKTELSDEIIQRAAGLLVFFSIALIAQAVCAIINRGFYAINDTRTPLIIGGSTIIANIILSQILRRTSLEIEGMTLSYSISSAINAILLLLILNKKVKGIYLDKLWIFLVKTVPAALVMGAAVWILNVLLPAAHPSKVVQVLIVTFQIGLGCAVYFGTALLLKVEEAEYLFGIVMQRLKRVGKAIAVRF